MTSPNNGAASTRIYVTLTGLPLVFHLKWPFQKSTSGADFWFLHADLRLAGNDVLHSPVAINLSATLRDVVPSLEAKDIEGVVINALRKEVDRRQLEFLKSGKLVPVQFSSRHYDFKRNQWAFGKAGEEELSLLVLRSVYWNSKLGRGPVAIDDATEALYAGTTAEHMAGIAKKLESQGLIKLEGGRADATSALLEQSAKFEADVQEALAELEKKHAFERG